MMIMGFVRRGIVRTKVLQWLIMKLVVCLKGNGLLPLIGLDGILRPNKWYQGFVMIKSDGCRRRVDIRSHQF